MEKIHWNVCPFSLYTGITWTIREAPNLQQTFNFHHIISSWVGVWLNQINVVIENAVFQAVSVFRVWNRIWRFVSIFIVLFSKGMFELEPVWQDSILLPNHLSWQRQWNQKSSSLWLHLPYKCCQKFWFSPVANLYPETTVADTRTGGAYTPGGDLDVAVQEDYC